MTHFRWTAWLIGVVWLAGGSANAQTLGRLQGTVEDATGRALPGVTLTLTGAVGATAQTNAIGQFEIDDLHTGDYELVASLAGFSPFRGAVQIHSGIATTISVTLLFLVTERTVVTASRIGKADVQEVPMAVSAFSGTDLERIEAHTVEQLAGRVPAVTFSQNTGWGQLTIRGIGTNVIFTGSDPSAAVYVDGVYLARPAMLFTNFLDLDRVEVVRGPQGTLYGRNAVGGAVNLITKAPTDAIQASIRIDAGNYNTLRAEARVSGPIMRGKLLGSAAFLRGFQTGYVHDLDHPHHPLGGDDLTEARAQLRIIFSPLTDLLVSTDLSDQSGFPLTHAKVLAVKPGYQVDNPPGLYNVRTSTIAAGRNRQYGMSARLTRQLTSGATLTSLTAFRALDYDVIADTDVTELNLTTSHNHEMQHQVSEEVTFAHQVSHLTGVAGLFLFQEVDRQPSYVELGAARFQNFLGPGIDVRTAAGFAQGTYVLTRRTSITTGLRYTFEQKAFTNSGWSQTLDSPVRQISSYAYSDHLSGSAWTPKVGMELRATDRARVYLSATRGFKSGGFNPTSTTPRGGYAPEWAWSYEGGWKMAALGGRTIFNAAVFWTDYTDLQVQTTIMPGVIDISNAARATIRGVEVEAAKSIRGQARLGAQLSWLDAQYDRYIAVGANGVTADAAGRRLSNAPEWSGHLWVDWTRNVGRTGAISLRGDNTWQSTVFFTPFNDAIQRQRPYALVDVSADFAPAHRSWSIGAYAKNLTSTEYITASFSSPIPAIGGRPGAPRLAGIRFVLKH